MVHTFLISFKQTYNLHKLDMLFESIFDIQTFNVNCHQAYHHVIIPLVEPGRRLPRLSDLVESS